MYYDAAKRVVFRNCMASCDLTDEQVPNFNANFYFNMVDEQRCLSQCFNTKMNLHFGTTVATKEALYLDFASGKDTYKSMQNWNPTYKLTKQFETGRDEKSIKNITDALLAKTKSA